jgi:hypothetical protein
LRSRRNPSQRFAEGWAGQVSGDENPELGSGPDAAQTRQERRRIGFHKNRKNRETENAEVERSDETEDGQEVGDRECQENGIEGFRFQQLSVTAKVEDGEEIGEFRDSEKDVSAFQNSPYLKKKSSEVSHCIGVATLLILRL